MNVLTECLSQGTSPASVISFAKEYLKQEGFEELYYDKMLSPKENGKFFITPFPDVLFAFTTGNAKAKIQSLRMAFAHVDQPCFKVKGKPDFKSMGCAMLNVEVYGGMMDHTWFDRPLGIAGTIMLRGEDVFKPEEVLYDSKRPIAVIPGLAIHMQREANNGWKIDRQKELMPLMGIANGRWTEGAFLHFLSEELSVDESEILSYDLNLYNYDQPQLCGVKEEILCSPRIDNLASVSALLESITDGERESGINLIGLFNHEEVGSFTKSGADSTLLGSILNRILSGMGCSKEQIEISLAQSYYLSVDGAHAAHPNYTDRCDTTTRAYIGQGATIKVSGTQKYASDCRMYAILLGFAEKYDILLQEINDRNTIRGGTTLGPMIGSHLPMMGCDLGIPMLAMHSARETMAMEDYINLCRLVTAFFTE